MDEMLSVKDISKSFGDRTIVDSVSFSLSRGERLGIEGRSGSGKTTLMKCILRLVEPDSGSVIFHGIDLLRIPAGRLRKVRVPIQMVPQDPGTTLNARMSAKDIILEGARYNHTIDGSEESFLSGLLDCVSLRAGDMDKRPDEFSGGEKARIAIARALALKPEILICDEITSSLDASLRSGMLSLLESIDASLIVISHDKMALEYISDRILYMEEGRLHDCDSRQPEKGNVFR